MISKGTSIICDIPGQCHHWIQCLASQLPWPLGSICRPIDQNQRKLVGSWGNHPCLNLLYLFIICVSHTYFWGHITRSPAYARQHLVFVGSKAQIAYSAWLLSTRHIYLSKNKNTYQASDTCRAQAVCFPVWCPGEWILCDGGPPMPSGPI